MNDRNGYEQLVYEQKRHVTEVAYCMAARCPRRIGLVDCWATVAALSPRSKGRGVVIQGGTFLVKITLCDRHAQALNLLPGKVTRNGDSRG